MEAAGGPEAAFLQENKGPARRGAPAQDRALAGPGRKLGLGEEPAALLFARSGAEVPAAMLWPRSSGGFHTRPVGKGEKDGRRRKLCRSR